MSIAAEHLSQRKWGVFTHYLYRTVCDPQSEGNLNTGITDWNEAVNKFDAERLAYELHKMNVGYYFITLLQGDSHLIAPNAAYDRIAGTAAGEACSFRDLPMDIANALSKYGIDLCLYYTGDGPWNDEVIGNRFGFVAPRENVSEEFVKNWAAVLEEYAVRYGDKVKAWWIDGCYGAPASHRVERFGYTDELLSHYYRAVKKGNPDAAVTFNNGVTLNLEKYYANEDFVAGESRGIREKLPQCKYIDGALIHTLFPIGITDDFSGGAWGKGGVKYSNEYVLKYIKAMTALGGTVTVDMQPFIDGSFAPDQAAVLRWVGQNL